MHPRTWHPARLARPLVSLGAIALCVLSPARPSMADCLASSARCGVDTSAPTTPTYSSLCTNVILGVSEVSYDVPNRTITLFNDSNDGAELFLNDEFTVHGPVAGTPITLHLRIRYHGTVGSFGVGGGGNGAVGAQALVAQPGDPPAVEKTFGHASDPATSGAVPEFADSVDFAVARTAGVPIGLQAHALVQNGYDDHLAAEFLFVGLPPGANVTSCKGYTQDQPVPAVARSWGSIKAAYR